MISSPVPVFDGHEGRSRFPLDEAPDALPPSAPHIDQEPTTFALVEWLLKNPSNVDWLNRQPRWQRELFPRFLLIALTGYLAYSVLLVLLLNLAPAAAHPQSPWLAMPSVSWRGGAPWSLPLAYAVGTVLAACVCLPSFYFYSLLAGVRLTWLQITSVVGKGMAANGILLLGLGPIYLVAALGMIVLDAPLHLLQATMWVGLALPFLAGLWGMYAIYCGVMDATNDLSVEWRCGRYCFLRRLVLAWSGVYAAVVPIMIFRLWEMFSA